ncbi:uncharacterized protein LOC144572276 [Carex rostrata]
MWVLHFQSSLNRWNTVARRTEARRAVKHASTFSWLLMMISSANSSPPNIDQVVADQRVSKQGVIGALLNAQSGQEVATCLGADTEWFGEERQDNQPLCDNGVL